MILVFSQDRWVIGLEILVSLIWLRGLVGLVRSPVESRVRSLAIVTLVFFLLLQVTSWGPFPHDPVRGQVWVSLLLLTFLSFFLTLRRLVDWLRVPRLYEQWVWGTWVVGTGVVILVGLGFASDRFGGLNLLLIPMFLSASIGAVGMTLFFQGVRREVLRRVSASVPEVFE